jgi:hypothetical protein
MRLQLSSTEQIRAELAKLDPHQIDALARLARTPRSTILKIRYGQTKNPGLETCRAIVPYIDAARRV